eukprot:6762671-Pyramimonas_sp.AAC.1
MKERARARCKIRRPLARRGSSKRAYSCFLKAAGEPTAVTGHPCYDVERVVHVSVLSSRTEGRGSRIATVKIRPA